MPTGAYDLRHTGGTLSVTTGATLKELMARLWHSSVRAAMVYQEATRDRDQAIARVLGTLVREAREPRNVRRGPSFEHQKLGPDLGGKRERATGIEHA